MIFALLLSVKSYGQIIYGYYIGFESIGKISDKGNWYHMNHLLIKGDTVLLYKQPIQIVKKDTLYSVSDGGFYYYRGNFFENDNKLQVSFSLTECDYCLLELIVDSITGQKSLKPVILNFIVENNEKLIFKSIEYNFQIAFDYQGSERYPIDLSVFYRTNNFEIDEPVEFEIIEPKIKEIR